MSAFETMQVYAMLASNITQMWAVFLGVLAFLIGTVLFGNFDRGIRLFIYAGCAIGGVLIFYGLWRHYQLLDKLVEVAQAIPEDKATAQTKLLATIGYDRTFIVWGTGVASVVMLAVAEFALRPRSLP